MSTKIFILKLQGPKSAAPKDYILVSNEHLTLDEFVADLQELYPTIPTTDGKLGLVLKGSYRMTPRQFLRYMVTTVAYAPEVEGGVCVPKLLGGDNGVEIVYGEGLAQPEQSLPVARRQSMAVERAPTSVNIGKLTQAMVAIKINEPSAMAIVKRNQPRPQPQTHLPAHENANHEMLVSVRQDDHSSPQIIFSPITLRNVPQCGGYQESMWVESEILANLPDWLDPSTVKLRLSQTTSSLDPLTWNRDHFCWYEGSKRWLIQITAHISW